MTRRALGCLEHFLRPVSPGGDGWSYSRLTVDGFPVELSFGSPAGELRYTCEVGGARLPSAERLPLAVERLRSRGAEWLPEADLAVLTGWQRGAALQYGAWIGVRHRVDDEVHKLYVEVPQNGACQVIGQRWQTLDTTADRHLPDARPEMVGLAPNTLELYYEAAPLRPSRLAGLLAPLHLAMHERALLHTLELIGEVPVFQRLPGRKHGFSIALSRDGAPTFSLFLFAEDLFDTDTSLRRALLHHARTTGWDVEAYARLSSRLAGEGNKSYHGMLAIVLGSQGTPIVRIGLSPPCRRGQKMGGADDARCPEEEPTTGDSLSPQRRSHDSTQ